MTGDRPRVLLVDDRSENLFALEAVLESLPCELVSVTSGDDALKALLNDDFAVVLLDVQMPGLDGFETAELIKGRGRTRTVPIIFVTAISKERHHVFRGYEAGAVDYVFKPLDPVVLRSKVAVFLELDASSRAAAQSEAVLRAAFNDAPFGMARMDLEGRIAEANRALAALLEHHPAHLHDRLFDSLLHPDDVGTDAERRASLLKGSIARYDVESRLVTRSGAEVPCQVSFALAQPEGAPADLVVVQVQDLRDRRRADAEREQLLLEQTARTHAEEVSERLRSVQRITDAALSSLELTDLVTELLSRTVAALGADTGAIVLHAGEHATIHQIAPELNAGLQTAHVALAALEARAGPGHPLGASMASVLSAEMAVQGRTIGTLHAGTIFKRRFSREDRTMLALAADRAALALERVQLFEREHEIAEELQRSLLPAALPEVPGLTGAARYLPAGAGSQVGGDWYDMVLQPDGSVLLVVGDVAGRGIAAASTMGQLRSALRAYAYDGHAPGPLLERLNGFQIGLGQGGMTTVIIAVVSPVTRQIRYASAGHPPPLLIAADGEATWLDAPGGVPLNVLEDATYREGTADLPDGATLILYTDGVVEVRGESIDEGFERLRVAGIAARGQPVDSLCSKVLEQALAIPDVDDDVTLLALRGVAVHREPVRLRMPRRHPSVAGARDAIVKAAGARLSPARAADLRLIASEVLTNALLHSGGKGPVEVAVYLEPDIRVEVADGGPGFVPDLEPMDDTPGGRGLHLLAELADGWGVHADGTTCVWFTLTPDAPGNVRA